MEEWKQVQGYENYEISNQGRIRNRAGHILKPYTKPDGYVCIKLSKNDIRKHFRIHRLVAQAFIPNPENKEFVDHINGIRNDNRVENLRWCTRSENNNFELARKHNSESKKNSEKLIALANARKKKVRCIELDIVFDSITEAGEKTGVNFRNISSVCKGRRKTCGGYHWEYVEN